MFHILKNNKLYTSNDNNISKIIPNCYFIKNAGSSSNPFITYYIICNRRKISETKILGGYKDLVEFLLENDENQIFVITNFSRAGIANIYLNYLEAKKNIQNDNNNPKTLRKDDQKK